MSLCKNDEWLKRMREITHDAAGFDHEALLALALEVRSQNTGGGLTSVASAAISCLQKIVAPKRCSEADMMHARNAVATLEKVLVRLSSDAD